MPPQGDVDERVNRPSREDSTQPMPQSATGTRRPPPRPSTAPRTKPPVTRLREQLCPRSITVSLWLWFASTMVILLVAAVALTRFERIHQHLIEIARQRDASADPATLDRVADVSVIVLLGVAALLAVGQLFLAYLMHNGRGWARWWLVISAGLVTCYGLLIANGMNPLHDLDGVVSVGVLLYAVLTLLATVAMFLPVARPWFRRGKLTSEFAAE